MFTIRIVKAVNVPKPLWCTSHDSGSSPRCCVQVKISGRSFVSKFAESGHSPEFGDVFSLGSVEPTDLVTISLHVHVGDDQKPVGAAEIEAGDLARRPERTLVLSDDTNRIVMADNDRPCEIHVAIAEDGLPAGWPLPKAVKYPPTATRVLIITRGTRGDIQPFIALARGLANMLGWLVTVCTELNCKAFVKSNADVSNGAVRFLPSGGDTSAHINTAVSRWAINSKSEFMQAMMLARSEIEFFDSAPVIIHWARTLKPHLCIYGFTLPNIAMMISELLRIPIIGFILQPSVIPSHDTVAVESINSHFLCCFDKVEEQVTGHTVQSWLKWSQENAPALSSINSVRAHYSLPPLRMNSYEALQKHNMPIVIPINPFCFGPRPEDWADNTVFTDFIFLRQENKVAKLDRTFSEFIAAAKASKSPIVLLAFSSMPIPRTTILDIAVKIVEQCAQMPRVIAMVGGDQAKEPLEDELDGKVRILKDSLKLLEANNAPFGALFPHMSLLIIHGGLGTTAEAIRSGLPVIVTGVLLFDQRFWGRRVAALNLGPEPSHFDDFKDECVAQVEKCLSPEWMERCREVAKQAQGHTEDGVEENVLAIKRFFQECPRPWISPTEESPCVMCKNPGRGCSVS